PGAHVALAAEREAVAAVSDRLASAHRVAGAVDAHPVGAVVGRAHVREAGHLAARREDTDVEAADAAGPDDGDSARAAREDLDAEAAAAAGDDVAPEREGR